MWEEASGWRRSKACKIPVTQPTWRWKSGRLSSANAPRYLAGILRFPFPSSRRGLKKEVASRGGHRGIQKCRRLPPLVVAGSKQVKKKKASSLAVPPHFPEEEVGDLTGDAPGRGRRSCLPDGEHQPIKKTSHQCCLSLSLSLSAKAPASR